MKTAKTETKRYCKSKLALLISDQNHYKKVKFTAAVKDYRSAINNLIYYAESQGVKLGYTVDEKGYLTIA